MGGLRSLVGSLFVVASVVALASCSSGDSGDSSEPLAALVGDDGKFDCHRMYTRVPVELYLNTGLSVNGTKGQVGGATESSDQEITDCPVSYAGKEPPELSLSGMTVHSSPEDIGMDWKGGTRDHRGWTVGTVADGDSDRVAAVKTGEGRGSLMVSVPTPMETSDKNIGYAAPDAEASVLEVVDGLEDTSLAAVPDQTSVHRVSSDGTFDCVELYRTMSLADAADDSILIPRRSPVNAVVTEPGDDGTRTCSLVVDETPGIIDEYEPPAVLLSVQESTEGHVPKFTEITTGPRDTFRGAPFSGDEALSGWEEYWNYDGAEHPVNSAYEGWESYNARYCTGDSNCITVTNYLDPSWSWLPPQKLKEATLPLIRWIAEGDSLIREGDA